jgi:glycosyltransferase involved in cell wall biosynthesis
VIEGHDILCFAPGPWDDIWRNRHQIMTRLAQANRVLYIEPWPNLRPMLREWRSGEFGLADMCGPRLTQVGPNLFVYRPPDWAPRAARFPLRMATEVAYMACLRRVLRRLQISKPILWLFLPDMEIFVGRFDEKLVIYHMVDEYSGYQGVSETWRAVMQSMEKQLARKADLVFVSSPTLLERKKALNECIYLIPNAVDYETFAAISLGEDGLPDDIAHLPSPVAGYVGAINDKLDMDLLARVADNMREWSLLLVGPVRVEDAEGQRALERLHKMPHVQFLGRRDVTEVPRYIAACDVCLLPYRVNEWTRNIDSLKLYEYLACGKPVVATDVPAVRRFGEVVEVATGERDFAARMDAALQLDSPLLRAKRRGVAAQNTWEQRVASISVAIEGRLKGRPPAQMDVQGAQLEREAG